MLGNLRVCVSAGLLALGAVFLAPSLPDPTWAWDGMQPVVGLLSTQETVVGEPLAYPSRVPAQVRANVVTLAPGQETGWHTHGMPVFGYVIDGELEVDYGGKGVRRYVAGEAMMEAIGVSHNGRNPGPGPVRILAVFLGADGLTATIAALRGALRKKTAGMAGAPFRPLDQTQLSTDAGLELTHDELRGQAPQEQFGTGYNLRV